jgi:hypothetical protein
MSMECVTAQQVISTALDREPVDSYQLEEAKAHCRTCPECGVFVRAQLVTRHVPLPEPPDDLADRVMAQVRAEAAEKQAAEDAAASVAAERATVSAAAAAAPRSPIATLAPQPRPARKTPRMWVPAAAAATVTLALVGTWVIVVFGMQQMNPQVTSTIEIPQSKIITTQAPEVAADAGAATQRSAEATGARSITVNGTVYKLVGGATVDTSTATVLGSTTTALSGGELRKRDVWTRSLASDTVFVADDAGKLFEFSRVTRQYAGLTFVLTSSEVSGFDQWPTLPVQISPPSSASGEPTFVSDGLDAAGVRVYRLANSTVTQGIGIAPNQAEGDPAAGNPNWTWWAILR